MYRVSKGLYEIFVGSFADASLNSLSLSSFLYFLPSFILNSLYGSSAFKIDWVVLTNSSFVLNTDKRSIAVTIPVVFLGNIFATENPFRYSDFPFPSKTHNSVSRGNSIQLISEMVP